MIEQLLGSKTRVKLLQLFLSNPNRSFYVREITRKIDEQINSVRRELSNLLNIGIIVSDTTNNRLYYEANQKYEFYEPLRQIFGKSAGVDVVKATKGAETDALKALGNVELLLYTGQFTRDERAGVDVLIVGNTNANAVQKFLSELEKQEGKELRYTVMTLADFQYRQQVRDKFLGNVLEAKSQIVVDRQGLLENKE